MFVSIIVFCTTVTGTTIPLLYNAKGVPFVEVYLANSNYPETVLRTVSMKILTNQLGRPSLRGIDEEPYRPQLLSNSSLSVTHPRMELADTGSIDRHISIGHGSDFLNEFGNFLIIPPVVVSSSSVGSLVMAPHNPSDFCYNQFIEYVRINPEDPKMSVRVHIDTEEMRMEFFTIQYESEFIRLSRDTFLYLINKIRRIVPVNVRAWSIPVDECTRENLQRFPTMQFGIMDNQETLMFITVGPNDYIRRDESVCHILIRPALGGESILGAPFLSAVAVHVTPTSFGFCDPL